MCGEIGGAAEEQAAEYIAEQRHQAGRRLHRRLHRAPGQDDGPRRRDRLRLAGHRRGQGRGARGQGRARRPHADRGRRDRGLSCIGPESAGSSRGRLSRTLGWSMNARLRNLDLLRPRRAVARHRRRRGPAATPPSARSRPIPAGTTAYGTAVGYAPLREWIAEHHGVAPEQVLVTNGSMQADAFLFDALVQPGDAVVVERPTYDRTLLTLRKRGADVRHGRARARRDRRRRRSSALLGGRRAAEARAHHPQLPEPGRLHAVAPTSASGCSSSPREYDFTIFEDDPYVELRFEGEPLPTMLSMDAPTRSSTPRRSRRPSAPGIRVGYLVGPERADRRDREARHQHLHLAEHGRRSRSSTSSARSGALDALDRDRQDRAARARARRSCEALARELPEARFVAPEGGYFLWVELPEGTDVRRAVRARAAERGVHVRQGHRLPARGRREHAAPGLLGRDARRRSTRASPGSPTPTARRRPASRCVAPAGGASARSARGRARAARAARCAAAATGRRAPRRSRRRSRVTRRVAAVGGDRHDLAVVASASVPSSPGSIPASFR